MQSSANYLLSILLPVVFQLCNYSVGCIVRHVWTQSVPSTHKEVDQICQIADSNCNSSARIVADELCNSSVYNLDVKLVS